MLEWPSSSWIERRSAPPLRRCVANEWRSACGCTAPPSPARWDQMRRRLRTSEVDSGAPRFREQQRRLVVVRERRAATLQVGAQGRQRGLADRHQARLRALALDPHLLGVELDRLERAASRAPRRAARRRRRARASRGRAGRARSSRESGRAERSARRGAGRAGACAGAGAASAARRDWRRARRARAASGRRSAATRCCARASWARGRPGRARPRSGAGRARRRRPG